MASVDIWGFKAGLSTDGRTIWPKPIKREAVRRVGAPSGITLLPYRYCAADIVPQSRADAVTVQLLYPFCEARLSTAV
ncbi:hypothetical protein ABID12_002791 [Martelella mangrovi]|uniref:Uncharacterized protein n=1 Tax=Martelella mangrovi TaxID=1397477 RepID=A0ABV2ID36_9HYPH